MGSTVFAQTDAKPAKATPPPPKHRGKVESGTKDQSAKATEKPMKDEKATKMKKDGTPDMRYKENKEAAKKGGKMKKDGTPDMRHKANKEAAAKDKK